MAIVDIDRCYRHYKNKKVYRIRELATNPNTDEEIVVYRESGAHQIEYYWRPLAEFAEKFSAV